MIRPDWMPTHSRVSENCKADQPARPGDRYELKILASCGSLLYDWFQASSGCCHQIILLATFWPRVNRKRFSEFVTLSKVQPNSSCIKSVEEDELEFSFNCQFKDFTRLGKIAVREIKYPSKFVSFVESQYINGVLISLHKHLFNQRSLAGQAPCNNKTSESITPNFTMNNILCIIQKVVESSASKKY